MKKIFYLVILLIFLPIISVKAYSCPQSVSGFTCPPEQPSGVDQFVCGSQNPYTCVTQAYIDNASCSGGKVKTGFNCGTCTAVCGCPSGQQECSGTCQIPAPQITKQNCSTYDWCTGECTACTSPYAFCAESKSCTHQTVTCLSGTTFDPCTGQCSASDYIIASESSAQSASMRITGTSTVGKLITGGSGIINGMASFGSYWNGSAMTTPITLVGANDNLIYGNINLASNVNSRLLLLQYNSQNKLSVSRDGGLSAADFVSSTKFCLNSDCRFNWSEIAGTSYWKLSGNNLYASSSDYMVAIGKSVASTTLEVFNGTTGTAQIRITDFAQNPELQLQYGINSHWALYASTTVSGNNFNIWGPTVGGSGGNALMIKYNGNIGVGLSDPETKFKIKVSGDQEGLRIINGNWSPFIIRNSADNKDLFRVNEFGTTTAVGITTTEICLNGRCRSGWGRYVGLTTGSYTGSQIGGYTGANTKCSDPTAYPGSHLCTVEEMLYSINSGQSISFSGWAWISNGAYTGTGTAHADCQGWTTTASGFFAIVWDGDIGYSKQTVCTQSVKLACCK